MFGKQAIQAVKSTITGEVANEGFCEDLARQTTAVHLFQLQLGF
jgi:hypothetical protein